MGFTKNRDGFTLVEVIAAFAVLAIVGGVLLQLFVVAARTNRMAYDTDKANVLAVEASEMFKANPGLENLESHPFFQNEETVTEGTKYTTWFDNSWNTAAEASARYKMELVTHDPVELPSIDVSYYPELLCVFNLSESIPIYDLITANNDNWILDIGLTGEGTKQVFIDPSHENTGELRGVYTIPVGLYYKGDPGSITVSSYNGASLDGLPVELAVYFFDIPEGLPVYFNIVEGHASENYVRSDVTIREIYEMDIGIVRIEGGHIMTANNVKRYLVR